MLNKVDTLRSEGELARLQQWALDTCAVDAVLPTSALTGRGVHELKAWAASKMPEGPLLYPKVRLPTWLAALMLRATPQTWKVMLRWQCSRPDKHAGTHTGCLCCAQNVVTQMPERFYVAEIIQEKVFKQYREEVPYCTTVCLHSRLLPHCHSSMLSHRRQCAAGADQRLQGEAAGQGPHPG